MEQQSSDSPIRIYFHILQEMQSLQKRLDLSNNYLQKCQQTEESEF